MNHQIARMAFSQAFQLLRITGIAFVILPYFSLGLLSDYKICGDSECESLMSRVQAIRDHHGKDCRFLNFRQGDTIFVYHKLMGKREDLWAGTIDKQFGYFPKDAVQEEQVYATMEKVVQTQKSDFICMNEFGYPIDSSHLDSDDDDNNQKIPNEESKTTQTDQCTDDTSAESPSASVNLFTESPVSAQQSDGTSIEEGENKNAADAPGRIHKEVQETPAGLIEQGGSPSSSWLGSSVTGWLGLEQEEQPANLAEGGGKGEIKERQAETSSMMGWLGFGGGEGNPNDAVKNREKHKEAANSLTSTMTRWLGFGGEKRTVFTKKEQDEEREIDEESDLKETFRSRRMSLDLEGSQLHEEEKEKTGTLDWLGNGLSSVLGFGMTNQGLGHKTISGQEAEETIEEKKEQPVSNSWLDIGIRDILGFRNDKTEVDESKVSGSNDKEKDTTLEAATGTENVDTSQSQPAQTTEPDIQSLEEQLGLDTIPEGEDNYISNFIKDSNKLNVEDKDQVLQYNTEPESASLSLVKEDTNNNNIDASHWSKDSSLPTDAASKVDQEDISPQAKLEEESQGVGGTYEERLAETEIEGYQMPQIIGKDDEDNTAPVEEKIKSTSDTVHDFLTRTHNSMGRFVSKAEEDDKDQPQSKKTGSVNEEGARITNHIDDTEDSTVLIGASNEEYARERSTVDTDALHRDISTAQLDESAEHSQVSDNAEESSGKSKPPFSSGSANERNEPTHSVKPDVHNSDILAMTDNNKETETHHAELVENGRAHTLESRSQEFRSSHSTNRSAPSPYEMFSEVVTLTQDTNMDNTDQDSASLQLEQRIIQDAVDQLGETKKKGKKIPQQAHSNKEKLEFEKEILNDVSQKSAIRSEIETETEEVEELQEEVKRDELKEVEESKEGDKQQKLDEEKQEKVDEIMEEKKQEEVDTLKAEERQQEAEDVKEKQQEVEELKEEEEQEQVEKVSKDETGEEVEEVKEQEKQEQLDKAKKEDKKEEVGELKDDKYDEVEEFKEEENVEEIEEEKKQEKADELQEEERQAKVEEFKDEKKLEEMEDLKEVEMQQKIAELKEEERQAEVEVLKEEKMQEEVQKLKEVEKQEEFKEVHGLKEKETEEGKEKHLQSLHLEVQKKNTHDIGKAEPVRNEKETQDEKPKMERMQTGKEKKEEEKTNQEMVEEVKAETKQVEEMQQVNDVEGEWWDKEEEESLKCSHELCPQAESESVRDRDEKISEDGPCSGAEATIQTGKQNYEILENGTRESQTTPTDGMEGDRGREEETKTISNVANADEVEKRNCKSNQTWNEDISNNANDISDPIGLDIDQIGATKCTVNDPQLADEDGHSGSSTRDSAESQAEKTLTHVSQDPATSTDPSGLVQNESPGAFGLFKNAFSFFSKRPFSETKETTESAPCLETSTEVMKQILDFVRQITEDSAIHVHAVRELLMCITVQVVSALPDDFRPGPDLYGLPWEPVIISSLVGLVTVLLFTCRCYSSVKSRMYRNKEQWMAEQVAQLLDDKCQVLETLSRCQQEYDELEDSLRDSGVLAQTQKTEHLEVKAKQLEHDKTELERDLEELKDQLDRQRKHRTEQERRITVLEESMKTFEEETKALQSQEEQAQTTLKVYKMNSDRLQRNLETAGEESTLLQESNAQLRQQVEGWAERVSELEADMRRCEVAHSGMQQDVANKDERIMSLTDRLLRMKAWDSDLEEEEGGEGGEKEVSSGTAGKGDKNGRTDIMDTQGQLQKVQKLIYAAKLNADLKSVDEEKDRVFAKLNDEVKAKEDLQMSIKELENEKLSLQSDAEHYTDQVQRLQQKLQIMTEMYQENELKLHRLLTVEEKERLQKEEKLHKADKNIALAMEELNNYRQRAEEVQEELDKTKHSYQTQISAHEKKAHNNWLAARAAERELADIRRENALLRQKLTDTQFKLDALDKDPYALKSLARPLPFRAERSPYGPSPLGRPTSETRPFLSPPTLMDGPPARLSPRMFCGPAEPPGGQGDLERSGGPHSDSGSNSPIWERDRRGPPPEPPGPPGPIGPPGYLFSEPGGPMYRRPPPPPGALGLLPPPGCLPPGPRLPHPRGVTSAAPPGAPLPKDMTDGAHRENSFGPGELEHSESGPGERRSPPEAHSWMGGPPPPDFYPPKGPGGPPMMPMWAPPPRGIMFPSRFPPLGPPLQPAPGPHYVPPMRPPPPDGFPLTSMGPSPSQQSLPSPPHSQSPEEYTPSPEDAI